MRHVGPVIRASPVLGPLWHRIVAWALALNLAANNMSLNCFSVRLDVSCCLPGLRLPGLESHPRFVRALREGGSKPRTQLLQWAGNRVRTALRNPTRGQWQGCGRLHSCFALGSNPRVVSKLIPRNLGSQPAEGHWDVQPHSATEEAKDSTNHGPWEFR